MDGTYRCDLLLTTAAISDRPLTAANFSILLLTHITSDLFNWAFSGGMHQDTKRELLGNVAGHFTQQILFLPLN